MGLEAMGGEVQEWISAAPRAFPKSSPRTQGRQASYMFWAPFQAAWGLPEDLHLLLLTAEHLLCSRPTTPFYPQMLA